MKTIIKLASLLILAACSFQSRAQLQISSCSGSTLITLINPNNLTNPSYSLNPGALTSGSNTFAVTVTGSTGYTAYVTGTDVNNAVVTDTYVVNITSYNPTFGLASPQSFTLGCNSKSVCTIHITNAQGPNGGATSYTLLSPGGPGIAPPGLLSSNTQYNVTLAGNYTVAVRENVSGCTEYAPVNITANTTPPSVSTASISQNILNCSNPSATLDAGTGPNVSPTWYFPFSPGTSQSGALVVNTVTASPTSSIVAHFTLVVTDNNNTCQSNTVIPIYQNIYSPNALIAASPTIICTSSVMLTNQSSTGIPPGTFFTTNQPVVGLQWDGPPPQVTQTLASQYVANVSGVYTLTVMDLNNGCTSTTTKTINQGPSAAFTHTVNGGQVSFSDASIGTNGSTTYFWDFGDGSYTNQQNPSHTYSNAGSYIVKFKLLQAGPFCNDSIVQSVTVSGIPCVANSNFTLAPTGTAQVWNASPLYPWNISAATWSWGDGSFSNVLYTSHTYSAPGLYNICLTVTVSCVASSSSCTTYSVYKVTQEAMILKINVVEPALVPTAVDSPENSEFSWNIIPNPNEGEFRIDLPATKHNELRLSIYDLTGSLVYSKLSEPGSKMVLVQSGDLPSGLYFVTLQNEDFRLTKRIVIKH